MTYVVKVFIYLFVQYVLCFQSVEWMAKYNDVMTALWHELKDVNG